MKSYQLTTTLSFADDEYDELRDLVSWAYANNYYHNNANGSDAFDRMSDIIEGAR